MTKIEADLNCIRNVSRTMQGRPTCTNNGDGNAQPVGEMQLISATPKGVPCPHLEFIILLKHLFRVDLPLHLSNELASSVSV